MLRLRNLLLPLLRVDPQLSSPIHHGDCRRLRFSTSAAPFSLEDYLVASCGLAPAQARSASKKALAEASKSSVRAFNDLSSARQQPGFNPDAVLALLSGIGLSRTDIADVVAADPLILRSRVDKLEPRLLALRDRVGLSVPQIASFLAVGSRAVRMCRDVGPKIEFFVNLYGSFENLLQVMKGNKSILVSDLDRVVKPNIALLHQCGFIAQECSRSSRFLTLNPGRLKEVVQCVEELGVPRRPRMFMRVVAALSYTSLDRVVKPNIALLCQWGMGVRDIAYLCSKNVRVLTLNPEFVQEVLLRVEELGVPRSSGAFERVVAIFATTTKEKNTARLEILKRTLGCSTSEVATIVSKQPTILGLTEESLLRKIQFMLNEAGLEPQYILERPILIIYSLEKRLVPRHWVIKVLLTKGLLKNNFNFFTIVNMGEKAFRLRFIDRHKDSVAGLAYAYAAACGGSVPPGD